MPLSASEPLPVGTVYVAHEAEVDAVFQRTLVRAYDIHVGTRETYGVDAHGLQACHEVLVDQSAVDHRHHIEHLTVGDAPSAHHVALYAQGGGHLGGPAAAAVYEYLGAGDVTEVGEQLRELCVVLHHGSAHLYYCYLLHNSRFVVC